MPHKKEVWPVMLTPYTDGGAVDYNGLQKLIEWYEENGVSGLFAVCQSSEMFYLSLRERVEIASFVKRHAKVPVIASGHISNDRADQIDEVRRIADAGVDAVVLISNRFAPDREGAKVWTENLQAILDAVDPSVPLGLYECPMPYKRLIEDEELRLCAQSGRFFFMKDTCCDLETLRRRAEILRGTKMRLYNANTATLLDSVIAGCAGFSGIMANFHPDLYVWLMDNYEKYPAEAKKLQALLTVCALIEGQKYPTNAKYHLSALKHLPITTYARSRARAEMLEVHRDEVRQMEEIISLARELLPKG